MMASNTSKYSVLTGYCPDQACRTQLFFPRYESSVECAKCGQRHQQKALSDIAEVTNPNLALDKILRSILFGNKKPKKGPESVKVLGFSNYECKILSPLLTQYGMQKNSGKAQLLSEMGQPAMFDCGVLGGHAFLIDQDQMEVSGYGRDHTGSMTYLRETLDAVRKSNNNEETLLPIHADGDGHCLVHAVSRALIGRELFWHALRANLKEHFQSNLAKYKNLFSEFVDSDEWIDIIEECDPDFEPRDGEPMGLRNIHIFGLANILRRPIILLDSITGIQSSGDYTGVFLPGLVPPEKCRGKDGQLNKPLCVAWSNNGHNHYIALVGVKGRPLPKIPGWMVPKTWGMPQSLLKQYLELQDDMGCVIGGAKCLGDTYIRRLMGAMETVFRKQNGVSASLVADYNQYIYRSTGLVRVDPAVVVSETARSVHESRLYRCFMCHALTVHTMLPEWFLPDGRLYCLAVSSHGSLQTSKHYSFPVEGVICSYNDEEDCLVPDLSRCRLTKCTLCLENHLRLVRDDGSIKYVNGDRTQTPTNASKCNCGYKHYWDGMEYDNMPTVFPVQLEWGGKTLVEEVVWFENESDPALNSNVFEMAQKLVQKHFPGEFGSERLVQKVVSRILEETASVGAMKDGVGMAGINHSPADDTEKEHSNGATWDDMTASKIILTGNAKKSLHKEELSKSMKEKELRQRIEAKAGQTQRRRTMEDSQRPATSPSPTKVNPKQQKTASNSAQQQPVASSGSAKTSDPPATNEPQEKVEQGPCRIRVSTSDGRQTQVALEAVTTYHGLQELLASHLQVPPTRQRIKVGFPPRELLPPTDEQLQDAPLELRHGDRVMLEILPELDTAQGPAHTTEDLPMPTSTTTVTDELLQSITTLQSDTTDDIDRTITSLALMAGLTGADLWTQVQGMPHMFARGGAFYEQVNRDLTLTPNKHCTLPNFPGKVFRYNATEDLLELCLEPHGHFRVEPGIEERILSRINPNPAQSRLAWGTGAIRGGNDAMGDAGCSDVGQQLGIGSGSQAVLRAALKSGGHGVWADPKMNRPPMPHIAFSGQGHSISGHGHPMSDQGLSMLGEGHSISGQTHSMSCQDHSVAGEAQSISSSAGQSTGISRSKLTQPSAQHPPEQQHVTVPMETNESPEVMEGTKKEDPLFRRVGPGCRILDTRSQNITNPSIDKLMSVAQVLEMATSQADDVKPDRDHSELKDDIGDLSLLSEESEKMDAESSPNTPLKNSLAKGDESTDPPLC